MKPSLYSFAIAAAALCWHSTAFAAQTWTYQFTPTLSRPYSMTCGECAGEWRTTADVAGTFTLLLDWDTHIGKILELDDQLVNVIDVISSASIGSSASDSIGEPLPTTRPFGIVPPFYHNPGFALGQITYINGIGHLKSDGSVRLPDGSIFPGISYEVWFTSTAATLNMSVPIIDQPITVQGATAAFQSSAWSGDLNNDGRVDARDYVLLRNSTGAQADYDAWRWSYGNAYFGAGSVPEPAAVAPLFIAAAVCCAIRRQTRFRN
jgi:hypothetical protein